MNIEFNPMGFLENLKYMGIGMLGIMIVILIIILITVLLNAVLNKIEKK